MNRFLASFILVSLMSFPVETKQIRYTKEADYILYVDENKIVSSLDGKNEQVIEAGVYQASKKADNYYRIDEFGSEEWIYKDSSVDLKEIRNVVNQKIILNVEKDIYLQPFEEEQFKSDKKFIQGIYQVSNKAFDWFKITDGKISGWIRNEFDDVELVDTLGIMDYEFRGVDYKTQIINYSESKRTGFKMKPQSITIHATANYNEGSNAQAHANLLDNPNTRAYTSWHFTVDDEQIIQSIPINEVAYHAGDGQGYGNGNSVAIEMCENSDGDFKKTIKNTAQLTARLLVDLNLNIDDVKQHKDHSGKECPRPLLEGDKWNDFINQVQKYYNRYIGNNGTNQGWIHLDNGNWVHYEKDNTLSNRWIASGKNWYLTRNGIMVRNEWIPSINGIWYFVDDEGKMVTDSLIHDGGIDYHFNEKGIWIR